MSVLAAMINGVLCPQAPSSQTQGLPQLAVLRMDDRGLLYGDGLFETMRLSKGRIPLLERHWQRLQRSCERLLMPAPDEAQWRAQLIELTQLHQEGVIRYTRTRGNGDRGYRPSNTHPSDLWQLFAPPPASPVTGIVLRWCEIRLSRNARLAGLKHLNRLEQVLAQAEWHDTSIADGLMLDTEGELVCGTQSNVFLRIEDTWVTPDLRYSGVAGVMREQVLHMASKLGQLVEQRAVHAEEVTQSSELFICNAVRGIVPVRQLNDLPTDQQWTIGPATLALMTEWSRYA